MDVQVPNYELIERLGRGAMAEVWLARHRVNGRKAAIKVLLASPLENPDVQSLFLREGEVLAGFRDENIVAIYDNSVIGHSACIVMEYLGGGTLHERMRSGPISVGESIALVAQLARALGVAHRAGVIHRDLKPANIMFREDGTPVVTDFGAARLLERSTIYGKDGSIVGTPAYMSPEQIQGEPIDRRSDLYSLGVIFHELLTGELPYRGASIREIASQHVAAPIPRLPATLAMLQPVLDRLLAKSPQDRYEDGPALVEALRGLYLADEELRRQVGFAASSAAWSSQLRALGFHLDAQGRTDARVAQGEYLRQTGNPPPVPPMPAAPPSRRWRRVLPGVGAVGLLALALALAWRYWPGPAAPVVPVAAPRSSPAPGPCNAACTQLRRIVDAAPDAFRPLRGKAAQSNGFAWSATSSPAEFGNCRISGEQPSTSLACRNARKLDAELSARLFRETRAALLEAMPDGQATSDTATQFVLQAPQATALLYTSRGMDADPFRMDLVISARAKPTLAAATRCDGLCEGLCTIANSAGAGFDLPYLPPDSALEPAFAPPGALRCVGARKQADAAGTSWYRCEFGDYRAPAEADAEFDRVGAALLAALAGWDAEEFSGGKALPGAPRRELRVGNGELIAELVAQPGDAGEQVRLEFNLLSEPSFAPLCH